MKSPALGALHTIGFLSLVISYVSEQPEGWGLALMFLLAFVILTAFFQNLSSTP